MRRLFWMAAGATLSTLGTRWTKRKAAAVAEQLAPAAVGKRITATMSVRVDAAIREGRATVAHAETRLRARLRVPFHRSGHRRLDEAGPNDLRTPSYGPGPPRRAGTAEVGPPLPRRPPAKS